MLAGGLVGLVGCGVGCEGGVCGGEFLEEARVLIPIRSGATSGRGMLVGLVGLAEGAGLRALVVCWSRNKRMGTDPEKRSCSHSTSPVEMNLHL